MNFLDKNLIPPILKIKSHSSKPFLLFLSLLCLSNIYGNIESQCIAIKEYEDICEEGFISGTKILTPNGPILIEDLKEGDLIIGYNPINGYQEQSIINISRNKISEYIAILLDDELIYVAPNQKFYLPKENIWIDAKDIMPSHAILKGLSEFIFVEYANKINNTAYAYTLTTQDHTFYIKSNNILAHNSDNGVNKAISYACIALEIGQVIIKHPVLIIIGHILDLASFCLNINELTPQNNADGTPTIKFKSIPERCHYERMQPQLYNLRNNFLNIKNTLEIFITHRLPNTQNYAYILLSPIRAQAPKFSSLVTLEQELKFNQNQKLQLRKLRQSELDSLQEEIINIQIALAFHFSELIDARNSACNKLIGMQDEISESIKVWDANCQNMSDKLAISQYENIHIQIEDILQDIEHKIQELRFSIEFYKHKYNAIGFKETSNILELIEQEEKEINSKESFTNRLIAKERERNVCHQKIVEAHFIRRNIDITNLRNNIATKIKAQRTSKIAKELAQALAKKSSIQFPNPKDPKKDDDDEKKKESEQPERKINTMTKPEFKKLPKIKSDYIYVRNNVWRRIPGKEGLEKDAEYIKWDHLHNDIELYDKGQDHYASADPVTFKPYKQYKGKPRELFD